MKASEYNQLSPDMERKLAQNERATYRVNNVRPDPDNYGKFLMPSALQIPSTDVIYDKGKKDFVTIAAIERTDNDGNAVFLNIVFTASNFGYLFLDGKNAVHQKIYQFLELCNYNDSNPNKNGEAEVHFHRVDTKKEAIQERSVRKLIVKAVNLAIEMEEKKAKEVAMALGIDAESMEEVRNLLEDYAEDNPSEFLEVAERATVEIESLLKEAIKKGIILNNLNSQVFEWAETHKEIYKYKKSPNKNYVKELADYLEENNPDELNAIKTRLG
jgi:predicted XRE-type DNA-binding protein